VENSSSGRPEPKNNARSFLLRISAVAACFLLLILGLFALRLAWGVASFPSDWAARKQAKDDCRDMALATGFETKWKSYSFDNYECLVKLNTPEVEGVKWLPFEDVKILVTNPVE
jgi:hypothetical protein